MNVIDSSNKIYFKYLLKRSLLGRLYREFILYPKLNKLLYGKCLDIGSGIGDFLKYRKGSVGADVNPYLVDYCVNSGLKVFNIVDGLLPFSENEFESVLLDNVIEHITDPTILILEIKRVLRKSGILVIGIPGNRGYSADPDHKFNYTENNLRDLLSLHQFTFDKIYYFPLVKSSYLNNNFKKYAIYFVFRNSKN